MTWKAMPREALHHSTQQKSLCSCDNHRLTCCASRCLQVQSSFLFLPRFRARILKRFGASVCLFEKSLVEIGGLSSAPWTGNSPIKTRLVSSGPLGNNRKLSPILKRIWTRVFVVPGPVVDTERRECQAALPCTTPTCGLRKLLLNSFAPVSSCGRVIPPTPPDIVCALDEISLNANNSCQ